MSFPAAAWAQQYTEYGDPTSGEQQVLEVINRARANPTAEGTRLGISITEGFTAAEASDTGPRPPLAMNVYLLSSSRAHSQDMWTRNYFAHDTLSPPTETWAQRIVAAGYSGSSQLSENIATGSNHTPFQLEDILMLDSGYPAAATGRTSSTSIHPPPPTCGRSASATTRAAAANPTSTRDVLTEDFGRRSVGPFILGVAYNDSNGNNFYDPGEGLAGGDGPLQRRRRRVGGDRVRGRLRVPVHRLGLHHRRSHGGAYGSNIIQKTITRNGENVKIDFKLSDAPAATDSDGDGLPDAWEMAHFGNLAQTATGNPDGDAANNLAEFNGGTDPMDPASFPGSTPAPGPAPTKNHGGGGGCGLTGLEALLLLAWVRGRARRA
jgi:hypothetical protein